jgi:superfamily II DNA or RNA helicase
MKILGRAAKANQIKQRKLLLHKCLIDYLDNNDIILNHDEIVALEIALISKHGQIFLPTGDGKTLVEVLDALEWLLREQDRKEVGIICFASHRIGLNEQLLTNLIKVAHEIGLHFDVGTVASDGIDEQSVSFIREGLGDLLRYCAIEKTTNSDEILKFVEDSKQRNRHILLVATYHSFDRLQKIPYPIFVYADEAHTVVEQGKFENVKCILDKGIIQRILYFTATPVHGCNGRGMENHEVFGPVLVEKTPRQAIDQGNIVPPVILRATIIGNSLLTIIKKSYLALRQEGQTLLGEDFIPRLLVAVEGIDDMVKLVRKQPFIDWARELGIRVIAFSSGKGYYIDGREDSRKKAFSTMHELNKLRNPFILFQYDILTEGIDVPNVNGILALRELNLVKFLQLCGRAARITTADRKLNEQHDIKSKIGEDGVVELNLAMEKPCFWVLIPQSIQNSEEIIKKIRKEYELEPFVRDIEDRSNSHKKEEVENPYQPRLTKLERESKTILTYEAEVYRLMHLADSDQEEFLKMLDKLLDRKMEERKCESQKILE